MAKQIKIKQGRDNIFCFNKDNSLTCELYRQTDEDLDKGILTFKKRIRKNKILTGENKVIEKDIKKTHSTLDNIQFSSEGEVEINPKQDRVWADLE